MAAPGRTSAASVSAIVPTRTNQCNLAMIELLTGETEPHVQAIRPALLRVSPACGLLARPASFWSVAFASHIPAHDTRDFAWRDPQGRTTAFWFMFGSSGDPMIAPKGGINGGMDETCNTCSAMRCRPQPADHAGRVGDAGERYGPRPRRQRGAAHRTDLVALSLSPLALSLLVAPLVM